MNGCNVFFFGKAHPFCAVMRIQLKEAGVRKSSGGDVALAFFAASGLCSPPSSSFWSPEGLRGFGGPVGSGDSELLLSLGRPCEQSFLSGSKSSIFKGVAFCLLLSGCSSFGGQPVAFGSTAEAVATSPSCCFHPLGMKVGDFGVAWSSSSSNATSFALMSAFPSDLSISLSIDFEPVCH